MGMDVYGKAPTAEEGKYFRNDHGWWGPLFAYCVEVAPEIESVCPYWYSNDGDGLDAAAAVALADKLQAEVSANRTQEFALWFESNVVTTPNEPCGLCEATGTRMPVLYSGAGNPAHGGIKCNACGGEGYVRPWITHCRFHVGNVERFIAFLRSCGGFEIW